MQDDGEIDQKKARELVKVFRPRRDGVLTMVDFVKSTDSVYKEFRLLQASIQNSSQIDIAFENILNVFFYAILLTIILSIMGLYVITNGVCCVGNDARYLTCLLPFHSYTFSAIPCHSSCP
jgi:hypothetical protein